MVQRAVCASALAAIAALSVFADERTVHLSNPPNEQGFRELATVVKTVGQVRGANFDAAGATFTLEGEPAAVGVAEWLIKALENPGDQGFRAGADDVARVWTLRTEASPRDVQEILTVLRTVADVKGIFNYTPTHSLALRGEEATIQMAEWILAKIDLAPAGEGASEVYMGKSGQQVQVFYLKPGTSVPDIQKTLTAIRMQGRVQKVFNRSVPPMLVVRGTAEELAKSRAILRGE